jgi:hypothetical protein
MKVIAVLSAFFLPGTFIAVSLSTIRHCQHVTLMKLDILQRPHIQLEPRPGNRSTFQDVLVFHGAGNHRACCRLFALVREDVV